LLSRREVPAAAISPITVPMTASASASFSTLRPMLCGAAPSAMRRAISRVRSPTE
jgi:hypothetical protein